MTRSPTVVKAKDMDDLWVEINDTVLWATKDELAYASSLDTMMEDCMFLADSCKYSLNMGTDLWLTPTRWTTLINQYVDPAAFMLFLDNVKELALKGRGIIAMDMKGVRATVVDGSPRATRRRHGACMRMITYRNYPSPTISLYSRTSYMGYIGGLDMMLAHKIAEQIANIKNLRMEDVRFRWHVEMVQLHGFKSLSYIFTSTKLNRWALMTSDEKFEAKFGPVTDYPTWKLCRYWFKRLRKQDKEGKKYSEMKYGAEIRVRRRLHGHFGIKGFGDDKIKDSEKLDTPIQRLTLEKVMP